MPMKFYKQDSNTTLVKVKSVMQAFSFALNYHSNTTLVKVKC